jgi:glutamate N-acetyltransferase/amino-acid N-acetyltransferase
MTSETEVEVLAPLPSTLPSVDRSAAIPRGFRAGGMACGIKASGRPDLALIAAVDGPIPAAGIFTLNTLAAAPVRRSRANLAATDPAGGGRFGWASAIVSTSGAANAATGAAGEEDQAQIGTLVAGALEIHSSHVLHLSTGVIGTRLPLDRVANGVATLVPALADDADGFGAAANALRTTDSTRKVATVVIELPGPDGAPVPVRVSGMAKGVGMIHPRMATMLSVLLTDAAAGPEQLSGILGRAGVTTWNQLSIDGDTSTNDTVFLLASGASGAAISEPGSEAEAALEAAVVAVARDLARQQAADGEGAGALLTCQVSGAVDDAEARAAARVVISSSLVKAAAHGRDPNWGRIADAVGNARLPDAAILEMSGIPAAEAVERAGSPAQLDPDRLRIAIAGHLVFDGRTGGPVAFDRAAARAAMGGSEILVRLDLGLGNGSGEAFGCDLTEEYVRENAEYTT